MNNSWEVRKKSTCPLHRFDPTLLLSRAYIHITAQASVILQFPSFNLFFFLCQESVCELFTKTSYQVCIMLPYILYWLFHFLFKELVVLRSYSIVNILDIVRFPVIRTLKIISRAWILIRSKRELMWLLQWKVRLHFRGCHDLNKRKTWTNLFEEKHPHLHLKRNWVVTALSMTKTYTGLSPLPYLSIFMGFRSNQSYQWMIK